MIKLSQVSPKKQNIWLNFNVFQPQISGNKTSAWLNRYVKLLSTETQDLLSELAPQSILMYGKQADTSTATPERRFGKISFAKCRFIPPNSDSVGKKCIAKSCHHWNVKGFNRDYILTAIVPILGGVPLHSHDFVQPIEPISAWRHGVNSHTFTEQKKKNKKDPMSHESPKKKMRNAEISRNSSWETDSNPGFKVLIPSRPCTGYTWHANRWAFPQLWWSEDSWCTERKWGGKRAQAT